MSCCLRPSFGLSKLLIYKKKPCFKYLSTLSVIRDKQSRNYGSNKLIYLQVYEPKQLQVRNSSAFSPSSFYDSLYSTEPCKLFKQILIDTHDFTGLPWFGTIIASAVLMKLFVTVPCGIFQQHLFAQIHLTRIELDTKVKGIQEKLLEQAKKEKWSKDKYISNVQNEIRQEWVNLIVKNNCHPFKATILFFVQFPFWLFLTLAIRSLSIDVSTGISDNLVEALQFTLGGPYWCQNLTLPDPTYILPIINSLALLINTEISLLNQDFSKLKNNKTVLLVNKFSSVFLRAFAVVFFFISATSPSAVSLFWASSSLFAVAQNIFFLSPKMRRCLKIPKTPNEIDRPFIQIAEKWAKNFSRKERT